MVGYLKDTAMSIVQKVVDSQIVAIFRGDYGGRWLDYAEALVRGGVTTMEITLNSPGALDGIRLLKAELGNQIALGAGTVLTADQVKTAVDAGASFIVAPDTDEAVIAASKALGVAVLPGAYTPTEIKRAYTLGADMVKWFPADSPDFLRAIRAPLSHIPIMATGGINLDNLADFLKAGAAAVGIGGQLMKPTYTPDQVGALAARFAAAAQGKQIA
jgi:2-dehydro-3-deoxyphosphogluconate aldolase/(4S)-4-hydroxy-2-oxoglutarate aldolase